MSSVGMGSSDLRIGGGMDGTTEAAGRAVGLGGVGGRADGGGPAGVRGGAKDPPAPVQGVSKAKSGLQRQFGRLGGAVSGRGKRAQQ